MGKMVLLGTLRDRDDERSIIEHIRRNGYISQCSLGDMCPSELSGGGGEGRYEKRIRSWARSDEWVAPPAPKHKAMF